MPLQNNASAEPLSALGALVLFAYFEGANLLVLHQHVAAGHLLTAGFAPARSMMKVVFLMVILSAELAHFLGRADGGGGDDDLDVCARRFRFDLGAIVGERAMRFHEGAAREALTAVAGVFGQVRAHFGVAHLRRAAERAFDHLRVGAAADGAV